MNNAIDIAIGRYGGNRIPIGKFAKNNSVGTNYEDISDQGGNYPYQNTSKTLEVLSDSAEDTITGNGARTVRIFNLNNEYVMQSELIALEGITPVVAKLSGFRTWRVRVETAGSAGRSLGNIIVRVVGSGEIQARITVSEEANQTLMALLTIPAEKYGLLFNVWGACKRNDDVEIAVQTRANGGVFQTKHEMPIFQNKHDHKFSVPKVFKPMTDIRIRGRRLEGSSYVTAGFDVLLIEKTRVSSDFFKLE